IALGWIRTRRAHSVDGVGRRKKDSVIACEEVPAGRLALPCRDTMNAATVDAHHELLIAAPPIPCGLEDEPLAIMAEIRFGVLPTEGQLRDVAQVALGRLGVRA